MKMKKFMLLFIGCLVVYGSVNAMAHDLLRAIINKDLAAVKTLVQSDRFNINESLMSSYGTFNFLQIAAVVGTPAIVATLIANGADVNQKANNGATPLTGAARFGHQDIALVLIVAGGADVDQQDDFGETPLFWAAYQGHLPTVQVLVNAHADVNLHENREFRTPLHAAIAHGTPTMVATLLAAGANVNAQDKYGRTPLHYAALDGCYDNALVLIAAGGANVDQQDDAGWTPLHAAAHSRELQVIKVLVNAHANVAQKDKSGKTPVDILTEVVNGCVDVTDLLKKHYYLY